MPRDSWFRTGAIAEIVWQVSLYFPWLEDFPLTWRVGILAFYTALVFFFIFVFLQVRHHVTPLPSTKARCYTRVPLMLLPPPLPPHTHTNNHEQRFILRMLFSYHGFLYAARGSRPLHLQLWGLAVKLLSGRKPMMYSFSRCSTCPSTRNRSRRHHHPPIHKPSLMSVPLPPALLCCSAAPSPHCQCQR